MSGDGPGAGGTKAGGMSSGGLTSRERFLETCRFAKGIAPPRWDTFGFWEQTVRRWHREGLPDGVRPEELFGMDTRPMVPNASHWHAAIKPAFEKEIIEEDETTVIYRNEYGAVVREFKQDSEQSMPEFLEFPVKNQADFEALRPRLDPLSSGRYPDWDKAAEMCNAPQEAVALMISGCFGFQRDLMGYEDLALTYYDDPALIHDISRQWAELEKGVCENVTGRLSVDYVYMWEDMAFKNGPLIGPDLFREFILPYYREVTDVISAAGVPAIIVDSDGDNGLLMPLFLEGGVNGFLPIEVAAGMDPVALRRRFGDRLLLCGGIDKRVLLRDRSAIEEEVRRKVPPLLEAGGYIPAIDHSVPPDVPFANYAYYVELLREITESS
jgi:uroporphyrinogen-III decarboxylase